MNYIFSLACVLLTTFTYTMQKQQYDYSFHRDSNSGKITIICKDRANRTIYIATKNPNNTFNYKGLTSRELQAFKEKFSQFEEAYKK